MSDPIQSWIDTDELRNLARSLSVPARTRLELTGPEYEASFEGFEALADQQSAAPVTGAQPMPEPTPVQPPSPEAQVFQVVEPESAPVEQDRAVPPNAGAETTTSPPPDIAASLAQAREMATQKGLLGEPVEDPPAPVNPRSPAEPALSYQPAQIAENAAYSPGPFLTRVHHYLSWLKQHVPTSGAFLCDRDGAVLYDELNQPRCVAVARSCAMSSYGVSRHALDFCGAQHVKVGPDSILAVLSSETRYGLMILGLIVPQVLEKNIAEQLTHALRDAINGGD